ncbi:MAG: DinB family protein [Chloroflexota bacterium]|nr:DinB family protein [Chloroflexota bacterium]
MSEADARWTPNGRLIPLLGIVNHLTQVEWRWIEGGMRGERVSRSEEEFCPSPALTVVAAIAAYRERAAATDVTVRSLPSLNEPCRLGEGRDLRWVLLHLINETARHAGHADATRELLDSSTGE